MRFHAFYADLVKSKIKIIEFLLDHEASMSEREIASILKVSHMSVNRAMRELSQMNFVQYTAVGKAHLWQVNRRGFAYKALRQFVDALKALPDPMIQLRQMIKKHLNLNSVKRCVLFGSVAKMKEKADSDIDVFVLVANSRELKKVEQRIDQLSSDCLDVFGNRLAAYIMTEQEYAHKKHLKVISEVEEGIRIIP